MRLIGKRQPLLFCAIILLSVVFVSCSVENRTSVRNYPANRPFVYDNKLLLDGNLSKDEKKRLTLDLENYWDDSLFARKMQQFVLFYRIKNPPAYDSNNVSRSITFMNAYLNSQGYYYANFNDSVRIDTVGDQLRTSISMQINVGKNIVIDSVSYTMNDSTIQQLTKKEQPSTVLIKGDPYNIPIVNRELDRLVNHYRQNGYYKFTREHIFARVDSTDAALIKLTLDPFEQAQLITEAAKRRKENPNWDVDIRQRPITDSTVLKQYYIGNIYFYPETKLSDIPDSLIGRKDFRERIYSSGTLRDKKGLFGYRPMRDHSFLKRGELYNEERYLKSINTMGRIGAWQQVDGKPEIRGTDSLDLYYFLVPAVKQSFTVDLEGSFNRSGGLISGNSLGISTNLSYNNRNVWKQAIQSLTTFRTGVELNLLQSESSDQFLQTFLVGLGHTYSFPRLIQPFKNWRALNKLDNKRTLLSINGSYVDRRQYYQIRSLVTSWGYEWKKKSGRGENIWLYKPFNLELYNIDKLRLLDTLFKYNGFLRSSFNEGNVLSQTLSLIRTVPNPNKNNKSHFMRVGVEEAGGLFGLIPGLKNNIYRFIKTEAEYRQSTKFPKSELAYRAFAGIGFNYGSDSTLPVFKQFTAGGPYSMRAWTLRQLGLGSSIFSDTVSQGDQNAYRDRLADMQLELNIEYRFLLATVGGFKIGSALYADIGNIWNIKKNINDPESQFTFSKLGRDMAIAIGTGLRLDFSYFLIRLDAAYKVKDPAREANGGWMSLKNFQWTDTRSSGLKVSNAAIQFGIGLPF